MVAVVHHRYHRHLVHLDELAQGFRHIGGGAAGGIAGLGVHGEDIAALEHAADGFDQVQVHGELAGADGADELHQPGTAVVAVDAHHVVDTVGERRHRRQLKVNEIHMVAEHHIRRLEPLHVNELHLVLFADEGKF